MINVGIIATKRWVISLINKALKKYDIHEIHRPWEWTPNEEIDFGDGLYGMRRKQVYPSTGSFLLVEDLDISPGAEDYIVTWGGKFTAYNGNHWALPASYTGGDIKSSSVFAEIWQSGTTGDKKVYLQISGNTGQAGKGVDVWVLYHRA